MLKGIPDIISPELLKILHEMGHGDDLVIGDSNYPRRQHRQAPREGRTATDVPELLDAILELFTPSTPTSRSRSPSCRSCPATRPCPRYMTGSKAVVRRRDPRGDAAVGSMERFAFYERAKAAYAVVATTEKGAYGCIIIKKGVVR